MKKVILEGCNGDWAQERYLPFLAEKAAKGEIELWAVDIEAKIKLDSPQVEKDWQLAQSKNRAHYLNKEKGRQTYDKLSNANYVFIVTPDRFHSKTAISWLDKLAHEGKIFIEKPLDSCVKSALELKGEIEKRGKKEAVFAFDHYLARAYPFLLESSHFIKQIGGVIKIEFNLLEAYDILKSRAKTLDKGAIFDLFCHALAVACATVNQNTTCSAKMLSAIKSNVKVAQCTKCPISGETFARIRFTIESAIEVLSDVGYLASIDKCMMLKAPKGKVKLDFVEDKFYMFDSLDKQIDTGKLLDRHVEIFLEEIVSGGKHPLLAPGVLSFDAALEILKILDKTKQQIGKMPVYQYNDSIDKILEILGERKHSDFS